MNEKKTPCNFCLREDYKETFTICEDCFEDLSQATLFDFIPEDEDIETKKDTTPPINFYPKQIKAELDKYIVGQEDAKRVLSTAVYNHYLRLDNISETDIPKNNIILIGGTGTGKTYLVQQIAKILDVPVAICDAGNLTQTGWRGNNVETILESLIVAADMDIDLAQEGIVFLDELDKIGSTSRPTSSDATINSTGVQQCLLKMVEGAVITVEINRINYTIDTKNILFIGGGAFPGLNEMINNRINKPHKGIGFGSTINKSEVNPEILQDVKSEDLLKFGFIPEFIGRFPTITTLNPLTEKDLHKILTEAKNCITEQYKNLFKCSDIELEFDYTVLNYIVGEAIKLKTGARSLRTSTEEIMRNLMYNLPGSNIKEFKVTMDNYMEDIFELQGMR